MYNMNKKVTVVNTTKKSNINKLEKNKKKTSRKKSYKTQFDENNMPLPMRFFH